MSWRNKRKNTSFSPLKVRRLRVEHLEPRQMLSGNVSAVMVGPTLEITALAPADYSNNSVQIWQGGTPGQFFVVGDSTTQINNTLAVPLQFTGVTNIYVALGPGSDTFQFLAQGNSTLPGRNRGDQVPTYGLPHHCEPG